MRSNGGCEVIKKATKKLGMRHREHIVAYGDGNKRRLTGHHETADNNNFVWVRRTRLASHVLGQMRQVDLVIGILRILQERSSVGTD
ncbi:hypothetical protein E2562_001453 [Oryza meyeriana var. granulata]|nr:hypothetical protein E2562_001453 [Oryza meyeriana var. granulata]